MEGINHSLLQEYINGGNLYDNKRLDEVTFENGILKCKYHHTDWVKGEYVTFNDSIEIEYVDIINYLHLELSSVRSDVSYLLDKFRS
jgi:predicted restriction endonuclease